MHDRIVSDARFVDVAKVRQARMMTQEERVLAGPRLFAGVCERMKEGLRDERPDATEPEIHGLLLRRLQRSRAGLHGGGLVFVEPLRSGERRA